MHIIKNAHVRVWISKTKRVTTGFRFENYAAFHVTFHRIGLTLSCTLHRFPQRKNANAEARALFLRGLGGRKKCIIGTAAPIRPRRRHNCNRRDHSTNSHGNVKSGVVTCVARSAVCRIYIHVLHFVPAWMRWTRSTQWHCGPAFTDIIYISVFI